MRDRFAALVALAELLGFFAEAVLFESGRRDHQVGVEVALVTFPIWQMEGEVGGDVVLVDQLARELPADVHLVVAVQFVGKREQDLDGRPCVVALVTAFGFVPEARACG